MATLRLPCLVLALCLGGVPGLTAVALADPPSVRFPLDVHYRAGRYFAVELSGDAGANRRLLRLSARGALPVETQVQGVYKVLMPLLVVSAPLTDLRWSLGSESGPIDARLTELPPDALFVGTAAGLTWQPTDSRPRQLIALPPGTEPHPPRLRHPRCRGAARRPPRPGRRTQHPYPARAWLHDPHRRPVGPAASRC